MHLTRKQFLLAVAYSAILPVTNLIGGPLSTLGVAVTLPFLGLAWIGGAALVSAVGSESAYLAGAWLTVLLQVLVVISIREALRKKRKPP